MHGEQLEGVQSMKGIVDPRITWTVALMQQQLGKRIVVTELAAAVNLSPSRFTQLFTAQVGTAPELYLQRLRLRRARVLIERTFLTVKQVMAQVGYSDPGHFSRDFRRQHRISPSALRSAGISHHRASGRAILPDDECSA
jgi:AraC family transcriptional regulator of arabinose operon